MQLALATVLSSLIFLPTGFAQDRDEDDRDRVRLNLKLNQLRKKTGQLCVSLFATDDGFPADGVKSSFSRCFLVQELKDGGELQIDGLAPGNYALAIFHDENNDKKLNTGPFGIPFEGFGFSNNPGIRMGPPKYAECVFNLSESIQNLSIELRYFL